VFYGYYKLRVFTYPMMSFVFLFAKRKERERERMKEIKMNAHEYVRENEL